MTHILASSIGWIPSLSLSFSSFSVPHQPIYNSNSCMNKTYFSPMETLSTSVSSLKVPTSLPSITTTPHELHFFKPIHLPHHLYNKSNPISNKLPTSSLNHNKSFTLNVQSKTPTPSLKTTSPIFHRKAVTGYAAALLNMAQANDTLEAVERDARRFLGLIRSFAFMDDKMKGEVVKELAEKGRFQRQLVVLVKMLVEKNKVGLVNGVLEEFERIYDELNGTQVVLVSSRKKMEEDELFGIAKRVQKMSGAMKVKVRNLINVSSPSFAV